MAYNASDWDAMIDRPGFSPPPGVKANLVDPPSFKVHAYIMMILLSALTTTAVALRIFVRVKRMHRLSLEDYLLLFAWVIFNDRLKSMVRDLMLLQFAYAAGYTPIGILLAESGLGVHKWNMTIRQLWVYLYYFQLSGIMYGIVTLPLKLSIIIQVLRAFVPTGTRNFTFWVSHTLIWTSIAFQVPLTLLLAACISDKTPTPENSGMRKGPDIIAVNTSAAVMNCISDAFMLVLPQQVIWKLCLPTRTKICLSLAFLGGILSFASAAIRLHYLVKGYHNKDFIYAMSLVGMWTAPEIACGFLVACLPVARGLMQYLRNSPIATPIRKLKKWMRSLFGRAEAVGNPGGRKDLPSTNPAHERVHHDSRAPMVSDVEFHELVVHREGDV